MQNDHMNDLTLTQAGKRVLSLSFALLLRTLGKAMENSRMSLPRVPGSLACGIPSPCTSIRLLELHPEDENDDRSYVCGVLDNIRDSNWKHATV